MAEFSIALLILVPLGLLVYLALVLIGMGMRASEMTDAARQRTAGCGILVLYAAVLACLASIVVGLSWLARLLRII